jgi:hypothetical protein
MAFSTLEKALATAVGLDIVKPGTSRKAAVAAARALAGAAVAGGRVAAPRVAAAAANPLVAGVGLGLGALATPQGQGLLESAAQRGQSDRVRLQQAIDEYIFRNAVLPYRQDQPGQPMDIQVSGRANVRDQSLIKPRKPSSYNKAVKVAMKAVKNSKFGGPKGRISNAKSVFGKVNKTISRIKKGGKRPKSGVTGVIARAVRRYV